MDRVYRKDHWIVALCVVFICFTNLAHATIHYVHPDSALNSIQTALNMCAEHDTVLVGPGMYYENITWPTTVGIDLISEHGPDSTIIHGNSTATVIDVYCVGAGVRNTVISGFTVENGSSNYTGGGIWAFKSYVVICNNRIVANSTPYRGGGIHLELSSVEVTGNVIEQNTASIGAGIYATGVNMMIRDNVIRNNTADSLGGGLHVSSAGITIRDNFITQNTAQYGGGICIYSPWWYTSAILFNKISGNNATVLGGGIYCMQVHDAQLTFLLNDFENNNNYGLYNADSTEVTAEYSWWGDASGPYHPVLNPGGTGDSVSDYVDFIPWSQHPVGIENEPIAKPVIQSERLQATIISGPLHLPSNKKYRIFDVAGRVVAASQMKPGIYFIEVEGRVSQKIIKIR